MACQEMTCVSCALCGVDDAAVIMSEDNYYNRDGARVVRCRQCGLAYTNPRLTSQESIYSEQISPHVDPVERERRKSRCTAWYRVQKITRLCGRPERLLEVGCGDCVFLEEAASAGWKVVGIDLSPGSEQSLREKLGLDIRTATIESLDPDREMFDVIVAWDVLEHVTDPVSFLRCAQRLLVPNGILALRVPNLAAYRIFLPAWRRYLDAFLRRKHREYDTLSHIYHFDTTSLTRLVESCGFSSVDVAPDADYAFSRPKNWFSAIIRKRRCGSALMHHKRTGENLLPELVLYARRPTRPSG